MNKVKIKFNMHIISFFISGTEYKLDIMNPTENDLVDLYNAIIIKIKEDCKNYDIINEIKSLNENGKFNHDFFIDCNFIKQEKISAEDRIAKDIIIKFCNETKNIYISEFDRIEKGNN
ncbi:hypothetical protein [Mesoplasma coleopterae]|uniref:Uncharacterized protein n=1 Tax=Mesoplasma coleopterae TaxID=324078 RepID=A0A2K8P2M6_9MOLU|nr:hypothetical protein [Mesoplasma coleopterae]ATZ21002.1 hypothetical protein MCOLE_v1c04900 [Mesoplasma coleopterae]